ncbi:hypothetical protein, conserved [Leishmania tarentolae]|uniref:CCHC-type domain-containing protein n=1 Tax=Leishmania tarentolae TaxID=5689 RepID=A0A640KAG7_LEITA|nr:hypothetical protein, conserved [Leishmania tarentolae]
MSAALHRQSSTRVALSATDEPLCAADTLDELLPLLPAALRPCGRCLPTNAAEVPAWTPVLPTPATVASEHRVQVSIRGRRFEVAMEVALTYSLFFLVFFRWPFSKGGESSDAAACTSDVANVQRAPQTVGDAVMAASGAQDLPEGSHLLRHYTCVVEPVLRVFLRHLATPLDTAAAADVEGESAAKVETEGAGDAARLWSLPPLPHPVRIAYDASTRVWRFEFEARLTAEAVARSRCQCTDNGAAVSLPSADGSAALAPDKLSNSPFLLLQSEYMGLLLVFLRRCTKVRAERQAAGADDAAGARTPYPALPLRWAEMNYDEQLSFVQLIRCFGVVPLARTYARPTAPQSTSLYIGAEAEGDACALRASTSESIGNPEQERHQRESVTADDTGVIKTERRVEVDDGDGLVLSGEGCERCGRTGHTIGKCRF